MAYAMGLERMAAADRDAWDVRAFGWVLVDLVKKLSTDPGPELNRYAGELRQLDVPPDDDLLMKQRGYALSLLQEGAKDLQKARALSREGEHRQAVRIYVEVFERGALDPSNHGAFGWDLFKATRQLKQQGAQDQWNAAVVGEARRYLSTYMKLDVDRPSMLHSCILQQALALASGGHLKIMVFARMWGLENLRQEDFERYIAEDGKSRPALAETVLQQASKEAAASGQTGDLDYIHPFVDQAIGRFPDNVWLKLNKVKILRALGNHEDARTLALEFARTKSGEYWAWELLGDLVMEAEQRVSCYCKALICSQDDAFVSGVRLKLARVLVDLEHFTEAKGEVMRVIDHKMRAGHRIPAEARELSQSPWYAEASFAEPHVAFYARFASQADELLFSALPWIEACLGERFTIEGQETKPRRKLYLRSVPFPTEVSVLESKLRLKAMVVGQAIKVRANHDSDSGRFLLHAVSLRDDSVDFDVFSDTIGVIDQVNSAKGVLHWMAGVDAHGVYHLADYAGTAVLGGGVTLRLAQCRSAKRGAFVRAVTAAPSVQAPGATIYRAFKETVRVEKEMGFTESGIFIPPDLVTAHNLNDDDVVSGAAVLSLNKKRQSWGWRSILID
ncbi:tetratricopeptide repeat protein [Brevundimonas sp. DC300-4]|uniref:tetratricopeptide repeat protein n=1 Tax=Brevundimonas sp. DC300-4 TaxID=2804594 RepID=UPI003CF7D8A6